jgi:hypothetical protein
MADGSPSICIHCGQSAHDTTRLNRLEDGRSCTTCAQRLLEVLAPALPGFAALDSAETLGAAHDSDPDRPA